ncbi:MAG: hypothetical protein AB4290_28250 [Spirulina sp.]
MPACDPFLNPEISQKRKKKNPSPYPSQKKGKVKKDAIAKPSDKSIPPPPSQSSKILI